MSLWQRLPTYALYATPAAAVLLVVLMTLTGRADKPTAATIIGGPADPTGYAAWRVTVTQRDRSYYRPVANLPLTITAAGAQQHGSTDREGAWEVRLPLPALARSVAVSITTTDATLASGQVVVPPWTNSFRRVPALLSGRREGEVKLTVSLLRAIAATSFPESALIEVQGAPLPPGIELSLVGDGAQVEPSRVVPGADGRAVVRVVATHHDARVEVRAERDNEVVGRWEGALRTVAGAMWLDPDAARRGELSLASPVERRTAYVTFFTEQARLRALTLPLEPDTAGGAKGLVPMPPLPTDVAVWALVSPDPPGIGQEPELVAWPLPTSQSHLPHDGARLHTPLLLDGMPTAVARTRAAALNVRFASVAVLAAAALIEALLLLWKSRQAKQELEALLISHADVDSALAYGIAGGPRFWLKLVIGALLISAGFGAIALVTWIKMT